MSDWDLKQSIIFACEKRILKHYVKFPHSEKKIDIVWEELALWEELDTVRGIGTPLYFCWLLN